MAETRIAVNAGGHIDTQRGVLPLGIALAKTDSPRTSGQTTEPSSTGISRPEINRIQTLGISIAIGHIRHPNRLKPLLGSQRVHGECGLGDPTQLGRG